MSETSVIDVRMCSHILYVTGFLKLIPISIFESPKNLLIFFLMNIFGQDPLSCFF